MVTPDGAPTSGGRYSRQQRGVLTRGATDGEQLAMLTVEGAGLEKVAFGLDKPVGGYRAVSAVIGSGAEETVAPPGYFPGKVTSSAM